MKCTRCGTNVDREATDRGICFDCYCQLDLQDYEAHLKASLLEFEAVPSAADLANKNHLPEGKKIREHANWRVEVLLGEEE